ncbi:putative claudin-24 [Triplophysa dalaica]|uniref:putative claudin-24 n=1 Tax=Triplophysa dalaica TaxID=1582913 RepID=UPI0024E00B7B|nr:putative claudin-24 [Triplophysa dalaica]
MFVGVSRGREIHHHPRHRTQRRRRRRRAHGLSCDGAGVCVLELLGVFFSLSACFCSLLTTITSQWLTLSTDLLPTESFELGLWDTCVVQDVGVTQCRPYDSLLGLPPDIRLARVLMCTAVAVGVAGLTFAIPGIYLVNSCKRTETLEGKRTLKMLGGILCFVAGVLGLVPVSYVAHLTVLRFFDESVSSVVPRWEFGNALFLGWTAGCLHLFAGFLLITSCIYLQDDQWPLLQSLALYRAHLVRSERSSHRRTEYV